MGFQSDEAQCAFNVQVFLPVSADEGIQLYRLHHRQESKAVKTVRVLLKILISESTFLYIFQGMSNGATGNFQLVVPFTPSEFVKADGQKKKNARDNNLQHQPLHPSCKKELQRDLKFFFPFLLILAEMPLILISVCTSGFFQIFFWHLLDVNQNANKKLPNLTKMLLTV